MPKGYFQASNSDSLIEQWYNVQSILKINQKLKNEIQKAADDLMAIVTLMDRNVAEFVTCS